MDAHLKVAVAGRQHVGDRVGLGGEEIDRKSIGIIQVCGEGVRGARNHHIIELLGADDALGQGHPFFTKVASQKAL